LQHNQYHCDQHQQQHQEHFISNPPPSRQLPFIIACFKGNRDIDDMSSSETHTSKSYPYSLLFNFLTLCLTAATLCHAPSLWGECLKHVHTCYVEFHLSHSQFTSRLSLRFFIHRNTSQSVIIPQYHDKKHQQSSVTGSFAATPMPCACTSPHCQQQLHTR
jgi:hypothetical protein